MPRIEIRQRFSRRILPQHDFGWRPCNDMKEQKRQDQHPDCRRNHLKETAEDKSLHGFFLRNIPFLGVPASLIGTSAPLVR